MAGEIYLPIGRIGSSYGIRGWVKICSYTKPIANLFDYLPWYLEEDPHHWRKVEVEDKKIQHQTIIVKFIDINNPKKARTLTGKILATLRSQLPPLKSEEYYWSDLEGLTVFNTKGEILGKIAYLVATGANDVLIVKGKKALAIPYLPNKVVKKIDLNEQTMIVDWEE